MALREAHERSGIPGTRTPEGCTGPTWLPRQHAGRESWVDRRSTKATEEMTMRLDDREWTTEVPMGFILRGDFKLSLWERVVRWLWW